MLKLNTSTLTYFVYIKVKPFNQYVNFYKEIRILFMQKEPLVFPTGSFITLTIFKPLLLNWQLAFDNTDLHYASVHYGHLFQQLAHLA